MQCVSWGRFHQAMLKAYIDDDLLEDATVLNSSWIMTFIQDVDQCVGARNNPHSSCRFLTGQAHCTYTHSVRVTAVQKTLNLCILLSLPQGTAKCPQ